jgi:hypothetical protein
MNTHLFSVSYPNCPGWTEQYYLTSEGDYYVATFKYDSLKGDTPVYLDPAGAL